MRWIIAGIGSLVAGAALAEGPDLGCYARTYSDAHLAQNPAQVVQRMVLRTRWDDHSDTYAEMWVETADQGHVAAAGQGRQLLEQTLTCWSQGNTDFCGVECDGGSFSVVQQDARGLTLQTSYLMVGDVEGCGGAVDLAEAPGQTTRYRLNRVGDTICEAMTAEGDY